MRMCDITFCSSMDCTNMECERNIKHLFGSDVLVSICDFAETCDDYMGESDEN